MSARTIFYNKFKELGAFIADFGGWDMPIYISSIKDEHFAVRENAGIFDVSHMSFFSISGEGALEFVEKIVASKSKEHNFNEAVYGLILNEKGNILDDVIVYKKAQNHIYLVANAGNDKKIFDWLMRFNQGLEIKLEKRSAIALQGPKSKEIISKIFGNSFIENLKYFEFCELDGILISRTGYTGELGYEIYIPEDKTDLAFELWDKMVDYGAKICGLGARDILRLEAGYPLYGHELTEYVNPIEAGLSWVADFPEKLQAKKFLVGLELPNKRAIPRNNSKIFDKDKEIGHITSGSYSFYLDKTIAMGFIDNKLYNDVAVEIRGKKISAKIVNKRFYYNPKIK